MKYNFYYIFQHCWVFISGYLRIRYHQSLGFFLLLSPIPVGSLALDIFLVLLLAGAACTVNFHLQDSWWCLREERAEDMHLNTC